MLRTVAVVVALAALCASAAPAQALQRLTVQSFSLTSDVARPHVDVPFHLLVTLHVRERVGGIDNLELPILAELELLGDERRLQSGPNGTEYRETISVVVHHGGVLTIGPAALQAIDARDGRAKQYSTNGLTLPIAGQAAASPTPGDDVVASAARFAFQLALWIAGTLCAIAIVVFLFRRRRAAAPIVAPAVPLAEPVPSPSTERTPQDRLCDALTVLRVERSRSAAVRVRSMVWNMLGASDGETLGDVLRRPEASREPMRQLLIALERAAFTHDADVGPAVDAACDALERNLA